MDNLNNNLELIREQNIKEFEEFLAAALEDEEYKGLIKLHADKKESKKQIKRKRNDDTYIGYTSFVPLERRTSARLSNKQPTYTYEDLKEERYDDHSDSDIENLENIIYTARKKRTTNKRVEPFVIVPVESVTDSYIANVAKRATNKKYSVNGTSCHQCRQKTLDSKTYCRNATCIGVRGQFCGPCLSNRYGEDATKVLRDPNWKCPPCRGICNCSICRAKEGKRPTGILAPLAFRSGHNSVKDFLVSLKSKRDNAEDNVEIKKNDEDKEDYYLLGFNEDRKPVLSQMLDDDNDAPLIGFKEGVPVTKAECIVFD